MRALRPDRAFVLPSGLWLLDEVQPVAAVVDPVTGALVEVVSWAELPPAARYEPWAPPPVLSDGTSLWTQQQASGPLLRIGRGGPATAAWTGGLLLTACGPGVAWCAPEPPDQELVAGPDPHPARLSGVDRLLRVDADGGCTSVRTEQPVRAVQPDAEGLLVQVDVEGWSLQDLGADLFEVVRATRWLRLPWDAVPPDVLTVDEHGLPPGFVPEERTDSGGRGPFTWYEEPGDLDDPDDPEAGQEEWRRPVAGLGLLWRFGWEVGRPGGERRALAGAYDASGREVRRWDLGVGTVKHAIAVGDRLCVVLSSGPVAGPVGGTVLALDPASPADPVVLLARDSVDVTERCWPLPPRRLDVDSYLTQTLADAGSLGHYWHGEPDASGAVEVRPLVDGMSDVRTELVGEWPHTHLQWTFAYARYPGLVLRRRVPLFDELGRPDPPQFADIHLMEDLDTADIPPASEARDGVLDV